MRCSKGVDREISQTVDELFMSANEMTEAKQSNKGR